MASRQSLNVNFSCDLCTLVYLIAEQAVISKQDGIFQKIVKQAGHNKQAGWNILEYLMSEQAEFHRKKPFLMYYAVRKL